MDDKPKKLLLHACCAPCSPHVIRTLKAQYDLTVYFYNPNIHGPGEYELRLAEVRRLCDDLGVPLVEGPYDPERFFDQVGPFASSGEGGERCVVCYRLRLDELCRKAVELGAEVVATTLTASPHKKAALVNPQGVAAAAEAGGSITFLEEDFKKKDGWRITCQLAKPYGFYRQNYCGCAYSKAESEKRDNSERPADSR